MPSAMTISYSTLFINRSQQIVQKQRKLPTSGTPDGGKNFYEYNL